MQIHVFNFHRCRKAATARGPFAGFWNSMGLTFQASLTCWADQMHTTYYAVASHYYKKLFCENSDVRFVSTIAVIGEHKCQVLEYDDILRETWKQVILPFSKFVMG